MVLYGGPPRLWKRLTSCCDFPKFSDVYLKFFMEEGETEKCYYFVKYSKLCLEKKLLKVYLGLTCPSNGRMSTIYTSRFLLSSCGYCKSEYL